jgi:hypothetical protein
MKNAGAVPKLYSSRLLYSSIKFKTNPGSTDEEMFHQDSSQSEKSRQCALGSSDTRRAGFCERKTFNFLEFKFLKKSFFNLPA